jgi:hypothetical protein
LCKTKLLDQLRDRFQGWHQAQLIELSVESIFETLYQVYGDQLSLALDPEFDMPSVVQGQKDATWLKTSNTVGINVRTIGSFFNIIPYVFSLPKAQNAIHILPIWEPGVAASLYGMASWQINPEFYDARLAVFSPNLNTVELQLKVVINLLHLMGKVVGMDVVPHTDRYSEMALANPSYFEWLKRKDLEILDHSPTLSAEVETILYDYLTINGSATKTLVVPRREVIFAEGYQEKLRFDIMFGPSHDDGLRLARRKEMIQLLYDAGLETVPATMGPPYRGIEIDPDNAAMTIDEDGRIWRDYRISKPEKMSRVFGPLSRFKLFETQGNQDWTLNFDHPLPRVWDYVAEHYCQVAAQFGFDFMRGDMSHVQMRPDGVPAHIPRYYDLLRHVKERIRADKPWFGYFAESFLAPPDQMAYGNEIEHLEASLAESTLGDLQSEVVGSESFMHIFGNYIDLLHTQNFAPNFTLFTADKDDPRFDAFYVNGNELRYFIGLFLLEMPSYMSLGFECRDTHLSPAPNEHYSKLYVFHMDEGPKSTKGPYVWGKNLALKQRLDHIADWADKHWDYLKLHDQTMWICKPSKHGAFFAWKQGQYIMVARATTDKKASHNTFELELKTQNAEIVLSTHQKDSIARIIQHEKSVWVEGLMQNECIIIKTH